MADGYRVLSSERVTVTLSDGTVRDGQDATIQANQSGVVFHVVVVVNEATFADPTRLAAAIDAVAAPYTGYFDQDAAVPGVEALTTFQDFDPQDNLRSVLQVTVSATDNDAVQTTRTAPFTDAIPERFEALVAETRASLDQLAG